MTDPVDEWAIQSLKEYDGKPLKSAEKGDLDLEEKDEKKDDDRFADLFAAIRKTLQDDVKEVKRSSRLLDSVACLAGDAMDMSGYMEKIMKATGQNLPKVKRVLELNTSHPVMEKIHGVYKENPEDPRLEEYSHLLYDLAVIGEGGKLDNPSRFGKMIGDMLVTALN
jgi:molecular chaperone HtpG